MERLGVWNFVQSGSLEQRLLVGGQSVFLLGGVGKVLYLQQLFGRLSHNPITFPALASPRARRSVTIVAAASRVLWSSHPVLALSVRKCSALRAESFQCQQSFNIKSQRVYLFRNPVRSFFFLGKVPKCDRFSDFRD